MSAFAELLYRMLAGAGPLESNKILYGGSGPGPYAVSRPRKTGAFGKLREATNAQCERWIIKEICTNVAQRPSKAVYSMPIADIAREIQLCCRYCPELAVRETFQAAGRVYLVMAPQGGNLLELASRTDWDPIGRRVLGRSVVAQVAQRLSWLHHEQVLHRDIKPENMLWNHQGIFFPSDFGCAKTRVLARLYEPRGTDGYVAPEMIAYMGYDSRSEVWSLGISYLELVLPHLQHPLYWRGWDEAGLEAGLRCARRWFAWRQTLLVRGCIDMTRLNSETEQGQYAQCLAAFDPVVCRLFLEKVFVPEPDRISTLELACVMRILQPANSFEEVVLRWKLAILAEQVKRSRDRSYHLLDARLAVHTTFSHLNTAPP